jgi:hypothetical protein
MQSTLQRCQELKELMEKSRRKADKAAGVRDHTLRELKREFSVSSIDELNVLLGKRKRKHAENAESLEKGLKRLEQKYSEQLETLRNG